jgi:hypothetical protein
MNTPIITATVSVRKPPKRTMAIVLNQAGKADDLLAVGDHVGEAARNRHHGERRDEGRDVEAGDQDSPAIKPFEAAASKRQRDGDDPSAGRATTLSIAEHHGGERHDGADREVDAADQDDQGHADGHDARAP